MCEYKVKKLLGRKVKNPKNKLEYFNEEMDEYSDAYAAMQPLKPETSRLLDGLEERHKQSRQLVADALSFADYGKEDRSNV